MSERISGAFGHGKAFIGFITGGDPCLEASGEFILAMEGAGADIIEIGVPFSDPIAEGPVIQAANARALASGTSLDGVFGLVRDVRRKSRVPLVLLTYLNPVFRRGYGRFFGECAASGVDGVIIPDMPFEEQGEAKGFSRAAGVDLISLIAPTSEKRISAIAADADGFVYVVSSMGVTGVRSEITTDFARIISLVREAGPVPAAVGFGVSTPEQAASISTVADGVIVGSAIVRIVGEHGTKAAPLLQEYVASMVSAIRL